jgi:L-ascorbate metabolism protein UlaG (beta-lactamase superfamily)
LTSRVTWFGHSTVLIDLPGVRLLTDPLLRDRVMHLRRLESSPEGAIEVDAVLISHVHWDHLDIGSLKRFGRDTLVVVPRGVGRMLERRKFTNVVEVTSGERVTINGTDVVATDALHGIGRFSRARLSPALGFVVEGPPRVYFAGDTDLFDAMAALAPGLEVALLPVAGWGPTLPPGHLDPDRAALALALLRPTLAIPIHWGTYAPIGTRQPAPGAGPADDFKRLAARVAPSVEVRVLAVGDSTELP